MKIRKINFHTYDFHCSTFKEAEELVEKTKHLDVKPYWLGIIVPNFLVNSVKDIANAGESSQKAFQGKSYYNKPDTSQRPGRDIRPHRPHLVVS